MAAKLEPDSGYKTKPTGILNSIFLSTVNTAANTLVSVMKRSKADNLEKWRPRDHLRFMVMLMTWVTVWALRILMDYIPCSFVSSQYLLGGLSSASSFLLPPPPSLSSSAGALLASGSSLDIVLQEEVDGPSLKSLARALTNIMALLNDMPASSRKYQFAMAMADKIMEENARNSHVELLIVNRTALSSSFARTTGLLYRTLKGSYTAEDDSSWHTRAIKALPMGSYIASYMKRLRICINTAMSLVDTAALSWQKQRLLLPAGGSGVPELQGELWAEKLAQELLWITTKLRAYGAMDEAMLQWGFASGLASLSLTASPRIHGAILRISGILVGDLAREDLEISSELKYRILKLWLPLFCHANNGVAYPVLSSGEKMEIQRAMDQVISTLPVMEQEVILANWLQDFAVSASDWPNLQPSYDRWCQATRELLI